MAYPQSLNPDAQIVPASKGALITASGSDFTATRAIHANVDETITVIFADSSATVNLVVVAGMVYPYSIKRLTVGTGVVGIS